MEPLFTSDPTSLGEYELVGRLGSGGFGVVFSAVGKSGEKVAIKLLRPELSDDQKLRSRLAREAEALERVQGDRTVKVLDVVTEGDHAYLVMELLEGKALSEFVEENGCLEGPLLWFAAQGLVEAIQNIHEVGVVHRDLKPSNVIYGPDGVKVLDFGISGIAEESGLTQTGALMGTAAWISPEQVRGKKATEESDVFNLGLVIAFMATGEHPFGSGRSDAVMFRVANSEPELDQVPEILKDLIERCLSKDPADRPTLSHLDTFFQSDGSQGLISTQKETVPSDSTVIVQPKKMADAAGSNSSPSVKKVKSKKVLVPALLVVGLAAGLLVGVMDVFSLRGDESSAGNELAVSSTTQISTTTRTPTTTTTTTAIRETTTTRTPTTTTFALAETTTTTEPPPPVFKLRKTELTDWDGRKVGEVGFRFNPCQDPIHINLNPNNKLDATETANLGLFLIEQSIFLEQVTGIDMLYMGLTGRTPVSAYRSGEDIDIFFGDPGDSALLEADENWTYSTHSSWDRDDGTFAEVDAYQIHVNADYISDWFEGGELTNEGQWVIMHMLGKALGLETLEYSDFPSGYPAGKQRIEIMYWQSTRGDHVPEWGPGDLMGLFAVGAINGCF